MGTMKTPLLVTLGLAAAAAAARAQQPQADPRWEAWLGCWSAEAGAVPSPTGKAPTVCVIPASGGVDVVTVVDTSIVSRDHIEAIAAQHEVTREGCTGWETDTWARQGDRLYRQSEFTCPGDVKRRASEVFAISTDWEWLDVQGLASHGDMGVRTLRYRIAAIPAVPEITAALAGHAAVSISRAAAAAPPTTGDVIEAARAADPAVVEAWLAEEGEGFHLDGKGLLALADSGVPPRVIDVMVAMTYPKAFTVAAPSAQGGFAGAQAARRPTAADTTYASRNPYGLYAPPSPWGWDYYSPWSWSLYGYYSPFFYGPYGQFAPYYWNGYGGGYYYGGGTIVVVQEGGTSSPPPPHGRIVNGRGYEGGTSTGQATHRGYQSGGTASSTGAVATPQGYSQPSGSTAPAPSPPPPSTGSSGSGSQVGQHAKPKP